MIAILAPFISNTTDFTKLVADNNAGSFEMSKLLTTTGNFTKFKKAAIFPDP